MRGGHRRHRPRPPLARRQRQERNLHRPTPGDRRERLLRVPGAAEPARQVPHLARSASARFARTGMSLHDEFDPSIVDVRFRTGLGGGLLLNQLTTEGHRSWVDWGKREYALDDPTTPEYDGEHGGITGIVYPRDDSQRVRPKPRGRRGLRARHPECDREALGTRPRRMRRPDTVHRRRPRQRGPDGRVEPSQERPSRRAAILRRERRVRRHRDRVRPRHRGELPRVPDPLERDEGWGVRRRLRDRDDAQRPHHRRAASRGEPLLTPGDYVVEVVPPAFYQVIKEEDQNTDEGDEFVPQIPPPPCVGPLHLVIDDAQPGQRDRDAAVQQEARHARGRTEPSRRLLPLHRRRRRPGDEHGGGRVVEHRRVDRTAGPDLRLRGRRPPLRHQPDEPVVRAAGGADEHPGRHLRLQRPADQDAPHGHARLLRRHASVDPDLRLPDAVRRLPWNVHRRDRRPGRPGLQPRLPDRRPRLRRLARQDDVRGHAGRPDLGGVVQPRPPRGSRPRTTRKASSGTSSPSSGG